jgi:hypothetical protein
MHVLVEHRLVDTGLAWGFEDIWIFTSRAASSSSGTRTKICRNETNGVSKQKTR